MRQRRRKFITALAVGTTGLTAGCINVGGEANRGPAPQPESDSSGESETSTEKSSDDDPAEQENPVASSTRDVVSLLSWIKNDYNAAVDLYRTRANEVMTYTEDLIERLEDGEDLSDSDIDGLLTLAEENATIGNEYFGAFYSDHYNFQGVIGTTGEDVQRNHERGETDLLMDSLDKFRRYYASNTRESQVKEMYSVDPISGDPVGIFESGEYAPFRVYETLHTDESGEQAHLAYDPQSARYSDTEVEVEQPAFFENLSTEVLTYTETFSEPNARLSESLIRINQPEDSYSDVDLDAETTHSSNIYIQAYDSAGAAETALERLQERATTEETINMWGSSWTEMFAEYGEDNLYAHVQQAGEFLVIVGMSTDPWENREAVLDQKEWSSLIDYMWVDQSPE